MEAKKIKMTFGIQKKHIERIEEVSAQYDSARSEESKQTLEDGWILYERSFWERQGRRIWMGGFSSCSTIL